MGDGFEGGVAPGAEPDCAAFVALPVGGWVCVAEGAGGHQ